MYSVLFLRGVKIGNKRWTADELDILKNHYKYNQIKLVQKLLPSRSYSAIVSKAEKLGIKTRTYWSDKEIKILCNNYHKCSLDEMMILLPGRTRKTIITMAQQYNLINAVKFQSYEIDFIKEHWKDMTDEEIGKHLGRNPGGIANKRLMLGLSHFQRTGDGYVNLNHYLRTNNAEWKRKSMEQCNYKCVISKGRFDDIHHIHSVNLIIKETLEIVNIEIKNNIDDYSKNELEHILNTFHTVQNKYPLGVCLKKSIHQKFHLKYGFGNNYLEQWNKFKKLYT